MCSEYQEIACISWETLWTQNATGVHFEGVRSLPGRQDQQANMTLLRVQGVEEEQALSTVCWWIGSTLHTEAITFNH